MQSKQQRQEMLAFLDRPMNPWIIHGKELLRLYNSIGDQLTWNQYKRWMENAPASFRHRFEDVQRVTKNETILALATEGLRLVERCEALAKERA